MDIVLRWNGCSSPCCSTDECFDVITSTGIDLGEGYIRQQTVVNTSLAQVRRPSIAYKLDLANCLTLCSRAHSRRIHTRVPLQTKLFAYAIALFSMAIPVSAQQSSGTPQTQGADKEEGHERILGVVPAFSVTNRQNAPPLTPKEKFKLAARQAYDPFTFLSAGLTAGVGQANNSFSAYGQGATGFARRYGAAFADNSTSNMFSNFVHPVLLKQDPRYFRLGSGTVKHRIGYSLLQQFSAKTDKGTRQFSFSNAFGALTSGAISNAYYPPDDRGGGLTMSRAGLSLLYGSLGGLAFEFWPDIDRRFFHKAKKNPAQRGP